MMLTNFAEAVASLGRGWRVGVGSRLDRGRFDASPQKPPESIWRVPPVTMTYDYDGTGGRFAPFAEHILAHASKLGVHWLWSRWLLCHSTIVPRGLPVSAIHDERHSLLIALANLSALASDPESPSPSRPTRPFARQRLFNQSALTVPQRLRVFVSIGTKKYQDHESVESALQRHFRHRPSQC